MKYTLLPNSVFLGIIQLGVNDIAEIFGLSKKERQIHNVKSPRVSRANKYMITQYKRLEKAASDHDIERFDAISDVLLRKSKVYSYIGMCRVAYSWYFMKRATIRKVMKTLNIIRENRSGKVIYDRIWIPKGNDKYGRPLGVPTLEWRIWSWMNLSIMEIWITSTGQKPRWQHGGLSRRGVGTAWTALFESLAKYKYIYEFDIKGFFNNITHESILKFISDSKMSKVWKDWTQQILNSRARKNYSPAAHEERVDFHAKSIESQGYFEVDLATLEPWASDPEALKTLIEFRKGQPARLTRYTDADLAHERLKHFNLADMDKGTPQGLNTSPFMSVMSFANQWKDRGLLMYMDDGLILADSKESLERRMKSLNETLNAIGCEIAPAKSGIVKEDGKWLKDLKFLGIKYNGDKDTVISETRAGVTKEFPRAEFKDQIKGYWFNYKNESVPIDIKEVMAQASYKVAINNGLLGLFLSTVYAPGEPGSSRELIEIGLRKSRKEILQTRNTFYMDNKEQWPIDPGFDYEPNPTFIASASTYAISLLLDSKL